MEVRFLNGGYCRQLMALVDRRTWRLEKFQAVFVAVRHPSEGWVLIDTGYSDRFQAATRHWPFRLYRWATPVIPLGNVRGTLGGAGIDPDNVRTILLTHFHADHIGGLRDFPRARFVHHAAALDPLRRLSPLAQVRRAFLPALLPDDFAARAAVVAAEQFRHDSTIGVPVYDVFSDGTFRLVELPGHAAGHVGVLLGDGGLLYAADAIWHHRQVSDGLRPMWLARQFLDNVGAYDTSVSLLRELHRRGVNILGCHCPGTQKHVATAR